MKIVIHTQDRENYGAHTWDGTGSCPQYWKYKIGSSYVIPNITVEQALNSLNDIIIAVSSFICESNDYFETYIISWNLVDDEEVGELLDEWEHPIILSEVDGVWTGRREIVNDQFYPMRDDIGVKVEEWEYNDDGERVNYSESYFDVFGRVHPGSAML